MLSTAQRWLTEMVARYRSELCGIYQIRNLVNGKCYVGSAVSIYRRWNLHEWQLEDKSHCNLKLQRAWNKYGPEAFVFEILELCPKSLLTSREQFWMDSLGVVKGGYNIEPTARSPLGRRWRKSSKEKASESALRVAADPEERRRRSERAKRQHAEGKLGRQTWTPAGERRWARKMKDIDRSVPVQALKEYWLKPENRAKQSAKLSEYCSSNSIEMSRRAGCFWDSLSSEERAAHIAKTQSSPGRADRISIGLKLAYEEGRHKGNGR